MVKRVQDGGPGRRGRKILRKARTGTVSLLLAGWAAGCAQPEYPLPTAAEVEAFYQVRGDLQVEMNGNVAELAIRQDADQLRRGGSTWARVGPYIYLFSEATQSMLEAWPGVAAIRVTTLPPTGDGMVATAFLRRDVLNTLTWRRALNVAGLARRDATEFPGRMTELIRYGEETVTEFEYNPRWVP
jgi:hypothetical protein